MMPQDDTKNFGALMDRTLKLIKQNYFQAFRDLEVEITTEQWVLIDRLAEQDGISQTELASDSFKNAPTVSRIIELLKKKKLISKKRSKEDKRQYLIFLTDKGKALHHKAMPAVQQLRRKGWHGLNEADYEHFVRMMNQIGENFS
ncbi:MAG: MarR family transcriptional regulator [Bacteroidota bacterium]